MSAATTALRQPIVRLAVPRRNQTKKAGEFYPRVRDEPSIISLALDDQNSENVSNNFLSDKNDGNNQNSCSFEVIQANTATIDELLQYREQALLYSRASSSQTRKAKI